MQRYVELFIRLSHITPPTANTRSNTQKYTTWAGRADTHTGTHFKNTQTDLHYIPEKLLELTVYIRLYPLSSSNCRCSCIMQPLTDSTKDFY